MSTTRKDLRDDEILRFLRFTVTESAAATYTQQSYDTQLSIDRGLIWMIHFIEYDMHAASIDDPAADAFEQITCAITRESKTAIPNLDDPDLISRFRILKDRSAAIGTDAGPMFFMSETPNKIPYSPPIVFAAQNIHVGLLSTSTAAKTVTGRIGYTLRRVSDKFFYRVAQALIS